MRDLAKSRRNFKVKLRKIRKRSKEHIRDLKIVREDAGEYVPISLGRRCLLRTECLVDVDLMLGIQKLFLKEQSLLNAMIAGFEDDSTYDDFAFVRMAMQTCAEE